MSGAAVVRRDPRRGARIGFWIVAILGAPAAALSWSWYGFAMFEAQSEQGKAVAAGTTMAGFGEILGGVPLLLAHLVGLIVLGILAARGYPGSGIVFAVVAVIVASMIGVGAAQLLLGGELFELGIGNEETYVP